MLTKEIRPLRACLGGGRPRGVLVLDSAVLSAFDIEGDISYARAVWLVSGAAPGKGRPVLLGLPHADLALEKLVLSG